MTGAQNLPTPYCTLQRKVSALPTHCFLRRAQSHATRGSEEEDCRVSDACRTDIHSASEKQHGSRVNTDSSKWDRNVMGTDFRLCKSAFYACIHLGPQTTWHNVKIALDYHILPESQYWGYSTNECDNILMIKLFCFLLVFLFVVVVKGFGGAVLPIHQQRRPAQSFWGAKSLQGVGGCR